MKKTKDIIKSGEIRALTGVRGIAAMWVVLFHFGGILTRLLPEFSFLAPISGRGHIGVDLFFVLSGFIISYVYSRTVTWERGACVSFMVKRFARIYPGHLTTLLALAGMVLAASLIGKELTGEYSVKDFFINLFLLHAFPISQPSWNYPSWSVSAEFFGYLVIFPISVHLFRIPLMRSHALLFSFALMAIHGILRANSMFGGWVSIADISFEFLAGAALYHGCIATDSFPKVATRLLPFVILGGLLICFLPIPGFSDGLTTHLLILSCPLLIAGMSTDSGFINRLLGSRPLHYLGLISYSIYMVHALVEKAFKVLFPICVLEEMPLVPRLLVFTAYLVTPVVMAILLHHFLEEPARLRIQKLAKRLSPKQREVVRPLVG